MNPIPAIKILRLRPENDADIPLPRYMTAQSAGMDVYAANQEDWVLEPGKIKLIPTGFAMALPEGFEAQIRPRSGLAIKHGIGLINSPGTIDADYRGEVKIAHGLPGRIPGCRTARHNRPQRRRIWAYGSVKKEFEDPMGRGFE